MTIDVERLLTTAIWLDSVANKEDGRPNPPALPDVYEFIRATEGTCTVYINKQENPSLFSYAQYLKPEILSYFDGVILTYTAGHDASLVIDFTIDGMADSVWRTTVLIPPLEQIRVFKNRVILQELDSTSPQSLYSVLKNSELPLLLRPYDEIYYANDQVFTDTSGNVIIDDGFIVMPDGNFSAHTAGRYWIAPVLKHHAIEVGALISLTLLEQ